MPAWTLQMRSVVLKRMSHCRVSLRGTAVLAALLAGVVFTASPAEAIPDASRPSAKRVWQAKCVRCHGADGRGATEEGRKLEIVDLAALDWQMRTPNKHIRGVIEEGSARTKKMRSFKYELTSAEIDALVKFIRTFSFKNAQAGNSPQTCNLAQPCL